MVSLSEFTQYLTIYAFILILIMGVIGNTLNLITFFTRDFRTKPSIWYLIWSTACNQIFIISGIILRLVTEYFGTNLINTDLHICKARNYLLVCLPLMSTACVFFASLDRCLATSTSVRWRQWSSISVARWVCPGAIIFVGTSSCFLIFVYHIADGRCIPAPGLGSLMVNIYVAGFLIFVPIGGMCICGILTWVHRRQSRRRVGILSISGRQTSHNGRMNRQLIIITFIQTMLSVTVYFIRGITFIYGTASASAAKTIQQQQIENLIQQVSIILLYMNHSFVFYLNCAFSQTFRKTFHTAMQQLFYKCLEFLKCGCL